jgi:drug/metabolite transporter (DMT)-like permease
LASNSRARWLAVLCLGVGASLWGVIWYPIRLLEAQGLAGIWLTLTLYAAALLASLPRTYAVLPEFARRPGLLALLMLAAGWTNIAFVEAVLTGNILRVLLLFYLSPLWATLLGWLVLRERIGAQALLSLLLAMGGALLMLWDAPSGWPWPRDAAEWYALSSGFAFAASNVVVRKVQDVSIATKAVAVWAGVVIVAGAIIPFAHPALPPAPVGTYLGALALGACGILLMTVLVQYGVTHLPVHRSAVIALVELVAGAASQQLLTDEVVTLREWGGGGLIAFGAYLAARASGNGVDAAERVAPGERGA